MNAKISLIALVAGVAGSRAEIYNTTAATLDAGGLRGTSAAYSQDASLGGIGGISTANSPAVMAKQGYTGQLVDATGLQVAANSPSIAEGGSRLLGAMVLLDDDTTAALDPAAVAWSVVSGPVTSISQAGLATAGIVYQTTPATVQGAWGGFSASTILSVTDSSPDNYPGYAVDGIDDGWQVQYFGLGNPLAAPGVDADGDAQTNFFEFTAGLVPTNPLSRFLVRINPVPGQPGQKNIVFEPVIGGRTYTVVTRPDLSNNSWSPLVGGMVSDAGNQRTVTDPSASGSKKFYKVEIVKP